MIITSVPGLGKGPNPCADAYNVTADAFPLAVVPTDISYTTANPVHGPQVTNSSANSALGDGTSNPRQPRQSTFQNPDAPNTGRDRNNKKSPRGPPIDKPSFEIECLKKQLNISHSKIKELETKLEKSANTNHILSERIKLFEDTNNKDIYEKYFPS